MSDDKAKQIESNLANFIGTENYYKHWLGFQYTDGIKYLADAAASYWLLDTIGSHWMTDQLKHIPFQVWELLVYPDQRAILTMREDSDSAIIVKQEIPYTDFPLESIRLYLVNDVLMLTSEY